jgi:hypothetical protein
MGDVLTEAQMRNRPMSEKGQLQRNQPVGASSAFPPIASN